MRIAWSGRGPDCKRMIQRIKIIKRRNQAVKIVVVPVLVQGEYAPSSIVKGIKLANEWGKADTIILGRGGGSAEDLSAFNTEKVAKAIFASEIPIISAVGHETDITIADFVADVRASTPSAAAEIDVKNTQDMSQYLQHYIMTLQNTFENKLLQYKKRLEIIMQSSAFIQPVALLRQQKIQLEQLQKAMQKQMLYCLETKQMQCQTLQKRLQTASPFAILKRGYVLAENEKGETLKSIAEIQKGDTVILHFQNGVAKATIIQKEFYKSGKEENNI